MRPFHLIKFRFDGCVCCTYRTIEEQDSVVYEQEYSVNDSRTPHADLHTAIADFDTFLTNYFGKSTEFSEIKLTGEGERLAAIVKGKMLTELGIVRVTLPKVRLVTDERELAVDLFTCVKRLADEVGKYLFENKVGKLEPIGEL